MLKKYIESLTWKTDSLDPAHLKKIIAHNVTVSILTWGEKRLTKTSPLLSGIKQGDTNRITPMVFEIQRSPYYNILQW